MSEKGDDGKLVQQLEEQLFELQSTVAFQEQSINELNDALIKQQAQLDRLRVEFRFLQDELGAIGEDAGEGEMPDPASDIPPHY